MSESKVISPMSVTEFRRLGYLQELNRNYLHPLGLALSVKIDIDDDGEESFGPIWDYRGDPEGLVFADEMLDDEFVERANYLAMVFHDRAARREKVLGYIIQPIQKGERDD